MRKKMIYQDSPVSALVILFFLCSIFLACGLFTERQDSHEQLCISLQSITIRTLGDANASKGMTPAEANMPFWAVGDEPNVFYLGAADPCKIDANGFLFQLKFNTYGAAIESITFCPPAGKDSNKPDLKCSQPFVLLEPVKRPADSNIMTMANTFLLIIPQKTQLALDLLSWKKIRTVNPDPNKPSISFESQIIYEGSPILKLVKTFSVSPKSYLVDCRLTIENVSSSKQYFFYLINGPIGIVRQDSSADERKVIAAFTDSKKNIKPVLLDMDKLSQIKTPEQARINSGNDVFLWLALVNKDYAAVIVPLPEGTDSYCRWIRDRIAAYYNPDDKPSTGDETIGVRLRTVAIALDSSEKKTYDFQLYAGPKDKQLFEKDKRFRELFFNKALFSK